MAAGTVPIFIQSVDTATKALVNADGTAVFTLVTSGANGSRVVAVTATTDDTAAIDYSLYIQRNAAGSNFLIGTVSVPAASGNASATPAVDLLDPAKIKCLDLDGTLILGSTDLLRVAARTAVTAAKTTNIVALYGDY